MRKAFFGILMAATAVTPIAAQAQESDGGESRAAARAERAQERYQQAGERNQARYEQRQERSEQRQERVEQRVEQRQERVEQRQERVEQRQERMDRGDSQRGAWQDRQRQDQQQVQVQQQRTEHWGGRRDRRGSDDALRRQIEASREASQRSADQTIGGNYARQADRNQRRYEERLRQQHYGSGGRDRWSDRRSGGWNRDWRRDSRYDWQRYRYSNRNAFRWGSYYAPYRNYSYRRLSIGLFLDSLFYSNRYWLNDPWQYRLPPAPYGTRWVRYYDDVLLIDVYSGEVVDVIYDFFW